MAQTNFTPISLYYSATATNVPSASNLVAGELAINTADGKLFYKDSSNVVQVIGTKGGVGSSTNTQVLYNSSGLVVGDADMTFNGTTLTLANDASISGLSVGKGGGAVSTNTVVGNGALATATGTSVLATAIGVNALNLNTAGTRTVAVGAYSLAANTTGDHNVAVGSTSMQNNTTGSFNVAMGRDALQANTTADNNTAVGYQAGYSTTTAGGNTFIGRFSGYSTTGIDNIFVGVTSGYYVTSGTKNVILGAYNGNQGGLDIRTASNYIVLSDGDGNPRGYFDNTGVFVVNQNGNDIAAAVIKNAGNSTPYGMALQYSAADPNNTSSWFINCAAGVGATLRAEIRSNGGLANYSANNVNLSDAREKTNVELAGGYLDKICAIPVKTFNYIDQNRDEDDGLTLGVIAQDVQAVAPELVMESNWASKDAEPKMRLSIYQTDLQYALMKAIQELNAKLEAQALEIATLKGK